MKSMKQVKTLTKIVALGLGALALSGCAAALDNVNSEQLATSTQSTTAPQAVYLASNTPNCQYDTLGSVSVRDVNFLGISRSGDDIKNDLQNQGSQMGGNAVIGVHLNLEFYQGSVVYIHNIAACSLQKF